MRATRIQITRDMSARGGCCVEQIPDGDDHREDPIIHIHYVFRPSSWTSGLEEFNYSIDGILNVIR